jgi:hypothetical protein
MTRRTRREASPKRTLRTLFERNGCFRLPNRRKRKQLKERYKKGYEVRLILNTKTELAIARRLLRRLHFKLGRPYQKRSQLVQAVYGKVMCERFRKLIVPTK